MGEKQSAICHGAIRERVNRAHAACVQLLSESRLHVQLGLSMFRVRDVRGLTPKDLLEGFDYIFTHFKVWRGEAWPNSRDDWTMHFRSQKFIRLKNDSGDNSAPACVYGSHHPAIIARKQDWGTIRRTNHQQAMIIGSDYGIRFGAMGRLV